MDIQSLKDLADRRFDHAAYRLRLREQIQTQLIVTHAGGMFKATPELISFVSLWDPRNPDLFLEDIHGNPIKCDRETLKRDLEEAYQYAMNSWHHEFESSKKIRKGKDIE